jgi:hypothetical protein
MFAKWEWIIVELLVLGLLVWEWLRIRRTIRADKAKANANDARH